MRRFECEEDGSKKFWTVSVDGADLTVSYGRLGTNGQTKTKPFASAAAAEKEAAKLVREKTGKGYVEVGAAIVSGPSTTTATSTITKPEVTRPAPSATPRRGRLEWLVEPVGGRDWVGLSFRGDDAIAADENHALVLRADGALLRVDLRTLAHERLATLEPNGRTRALAIRGDRWVASIGRVGEASPGAWLDGRAIEGELAQPCFSSDGTVLGLRGEEIVRVDAGGDVRWRGAFRGLLADANGEPVVARRGEVWLPSGGGEGRRIASRVQEAPAWVLASARYAVVGHWMKSASSARFVWNVSVWTLASGEERTIELLAGTSVLRGETLWWAEGELDLETLEQRSFEVPRYGPVDFTPTMTVVGDEVWVLLRDGAVRRFTASDHVELGARPMHVASDIWSASVADDGTTALGRDGRWDVWDAAGVHTHHVDGEQFSHVCLSPDGSRLAVGGDHGTQLFDARAWTELARRDLVGSLAFSHDGDRLLIGDDRQLLLVDGRTLKNAALLPAKGYLAGHFDGGHIVARSLDGVFVWDDPGPIAAGKPPKLAPKTRLWGESHAHVVGDELAIAQGEELAFVDLASGKRTRERKARVVFGIRGGAYAVEDADGASLHRWGEPAPFARLPVMPELLDANADGSRVVVVLARGVARWIEEGGRTPASPPYVYALPGTGQPRGLPGFTERTEAYVLHGLVAWLPGVEARRVAEQVTGRFPGVLAIPGGDGKEPGSRLALHVGWEIASTEASSDGTESHPIQLDRRASQHASERFVSTRDAIMRMLAAMPGIDLSHADGADLLVACGSLSSAELKTGDEELHVSWEGEPARVLPRGSTGQLVCWTD